MALGKHAIQSETYENYTASLAVDGFTNPNQYPDTCSRTTAMNYAWIEVDLVDMYTIFHVILFNWGTPDCEYSNLHKWSTSFMKMQTNLSVRYLCQGAYKLNAMNLVNSKLDNHF